MSDAVMEKNKKLSKNKMQQYENSESSQNGKRPHIRKAHWERYHVGEGRKDIITKWKEPVFVNGDFNDIVANIHVVTNKEADCSLGEGLVKQYLEAKKSLFVQNIIYEKYEKDMIFRWNGIKHYFLLNLMENSILSRSIAGEGKRIFEKKTS